MSSNITIIPKTNTSTSASTSVYGTTPGGTPRISYSRDELLNLASSPLSRSPPKFDLPAAISRSPKVDSEAEREDRTPAANAIHEEHEDRDAESDAEAFAMDL